MTMPDDADYYRRRAAQANAHAAAATLPEVRCVHIAMAERYRSLQYQAEGRAADGGIVHGGTDLFRRE